jgi:ABC-2 type transport system ATP-binding protein
MSGNAVEIRGLEKAFPSFKLGPLNMTVPAGAIYGFVGPNGSGKTTTIDLIFGMGARDAGSIRVLGLDHVEDEVAVKRQTAYVGPDLFYQPWGRVGSVIQFVRGFYPTWDHAYCERLMAALEIGANDRVRTLSFGARVKLSLLLALAWRPKLLILDEPTAGLDAVSKQAIFGELLAAVQEEERTVLISSHGLADVERFADHLGMIKNGRLIVEGSTTEVIGRFRMVDFRAVDADRVADQPGVFVQRRDEQRWRVLLDLQRSSLDRLRSLGVTPLAEAPVTLEELFIALARA